MSVDLSSGQQGLVRFASGEEFWCLSIEPDGDDYLVRLENGWYAVYSRDGESLQSGEIVHKDGTHEVVKGSEKHRIAHFDPTVKYRPGMATEARI